MQDNDKVLIMGLANGVIVDPAKELLRSEPLEEYDLTFIHFGSGRDVMITESYFNKLLIIPAIPYLEKWEVNWVTKNKASKLEKEQRGKRKHDPRLHVESLASREQLKKERIQALLSKRKTRS